LVWALSLALAAALVIVNSPARAEYPERPITLLVGFAPGGSLDLSARALAASAEKILGKPVIIENKTGGTGTVALAALLSQNPDGYTLCATPSSVLIRVPQMQKVPFKPLKSFKPIIGYTAPQLGIAVRTDSPWKSLRDLVNDARKNPGKLKYATTGVGSTTHAAVEEIAARDKVQMIHVPYKGSNEAMTALMGGHVQFASLTSEFVPLVKAGKLRLLATMGEERSPTFPRVPTMKEAGYDFVTDAVYAIVAPAQLPPDLGNKLEKAFSQAIKDKQYLNTISKMDLVPVFYNSRNFEKFLRVNWGVINRHLVSAGLVKQAATPPE
jgi:tripartite-type tricarboxylate transporter receptor subunit TctC